MYSKLAFRTQILSTLVIPTIIPTLIFAAIGGFVYLVSLDNQIHLPAKMVAQSIATLASDEVSGQKITELSKIACFGLQITPEVNKLEILDHGKRKLVSCHRPSFSNEDKDAVITPVFSVDLLSATSVTSPITLDPEKAIGYVRVVNSHKIITKKMADGVITLAMTALMIIMLFIVIATWLGLKLSDELNTMLNALIEANTGDFDPKHTKITGGPVGRLQHQLIDMIKTYVDLTSNLDAEVKLKTLELLIEAENSNKANQDKRRLILKTNEVVENERRMIAYDLHDSLNAVILSIKGNARQACAVIDAAVQYSNFTNIKVLLSSVEKNTTFLYQLSRDLVEKLRPGILDEFGLSEALEHLLETLQKTHNSCQFRFFANPDFPLCSYDFNIVLYRIVQEAISNIIKHARASTCDLSLSSEVVGDRYHICILVEDDGVGFDPDIPNAGTGLIGMNERAEGIDGTLNIYSDGVGGTRLVFEGTFPVTIST